MPKNLIAIELIVRGEARAYTPQEILDRFEEQWSYVSESLFDDYLPYQIKAKDLTLSYGIKKSKLRENVVEEFKKYESKLFLHFLKKLSAISQELESSQGMIFYNSQQALKAANDLKSLVDQSGSLNIITDEARLRQVEAFLDATLGRWEANLVLPDEEKNDTHS